MKNIKYKGLGVILLLTLLVLAAYLVYADEEKAEFCTDWACLGAAGCQEGALDIEHCEMILCIGGGAAICIFPIR